MSRELISSEKFPPKPHNCPAVKVPGLVFCAGQTATGEIKQATKIALQDLKEVLELAGSSLEQVVKYNVYLAEMKDFAAMNEAYIDFLPKPMPSRSCLQAVPPGPGTVIEIECIAQMVSEKLNSLHRLPVKHVQQLGYAIHSLSDLKPHKNEGHSRFRG